MIRQAVILIPEGGEEPPGFLFGPVAGVPFLHRQVLGLRRAGITDITILAAHATQEYLIREFDRQQSLPTKIKIISRWSDYVEPSDMELETGYFLILLVNTLPDQKIFKALVQNPPLPGALALGLLAQTRQVLPGGEKNYSVPETGAMPTLSLNRSLVTSLGISDSKNGFQAAGLALFSGEAWKDWHNWMLEQGAESLSKHNSAAADFYSYLTQKVMEHQVLGVVLEESGILSICDDQDQAAATTHLIAAQNSSPMGEGILENSWNRKIARQILPWILPWSITPNQITLVSFLVSLLAVWGFAQGSYGASVGAAFLLPLVLVMDCLDGAVARLKFQESRLGASLDLHGDTLINLLLFLGITLGSYRSSGRPLFLAGGLLLTFGYVNCWRLKKTALKPAMAADPDGQMSSSEKILEEAASRDFFYIILLMAILNWLDWMIIATAVGSNIFALILSRGKSDGKN